MRRATIVCLVAMSLAGCQHVRESSGLGAEAHGTLSKSPIGSTFRNQYVNDWGQIVTDTYQLQSDHSVRRINHEAATKD